MNRSQLVQQIRTKQNYLCVGLDTDITKLPKHLLGKPNAVIDFNKAIIKSAKMVTLITYIFYLKTLGSIIHFKTCAVSFSNSSGLNKNSIATNPHLLIFLSQHIQFRALGAFPTGF